MLSFTDLRAECNANPGRCDQFYQDFKELASWVVPTSPEEVAIIALTGGGGYAIRIGSKVLKTTFRSTKQA